MVLTAEERKELRDHLNSMDSLNDIVQFITVNFKTEKKLNALTKPIIVSGVLTLIDTCNLERS